MDTISMSEIYELDRGTVSPSERSRRLAILKENGTPYKNYTTRVGPGLANMSIEIKRLIDRDITPLLQANINDIMESRFPLVYADVKVYPSTHQEDAFVLDEHPWEEEYLHVLVNFVVSIPKDDSLDTMARATLLSFFNAEEDWTDSDKKIKKLKKKLKLYDLLNIDFITDHVNRFNFDGFSPDNYSGVNLEIDCDGIIESKFEALKIKALGPDLLSKRMSEKSNNTKLKKITPENIKPEAPVVIAKLLDALGVKKVAPEKIKRNDSLYALSGYQDNICKSLVQSFKIHFDTITVIGGPDMITVGDAIDFATEILEMRAEDQE